MKLCPKCKLDKPLQEFYRHKRQASGRTCWCKVCMREYGTAYYEREKVRIQKQHRKYYRKNKVAMKRTSATWRKKNPGKIKDITRRHLFGMEPSEYQALLTLQKGCCALCLDKLQVPNVDHCHNTGVTRGLLCRGCNLGLGNFKDSSVVLRRAVRYLEKQTSK